MLSASRMRAAGSQARQLAVDGDLRRRAEDDGAAQRVLREAALHLRGHRRGQEERGGEGENAAEHGVVALQGLEPRTCGL